jgi:hypothetical protein
MARLKQMGAAAYLQSTDQDDRSWSLILSRIASGRRDWLGLAQALKPVADGAAAEELTTVVAEALVKNPAGVLSLLSSSGGRSTWRVRTVCDAPIPTPGKTWLRRYKAEAIRAVSTVRAPDLADQKQLCLRALGGIDLSKPEAAYD